ncbi:hypothetical protein [Breznakiella homolactica]|uniref:Uncharacterized protein n=1 Tax=Breznakiella homolactica TaxID=2798577 RepID=A0A7T8BCC6_9SPIR|nr:hypothetical protein [Breznakiella homolactica]QQO11000.1 hypothetical protein JFL75_08800 [Breznakiella homolactica]
MSLFSGIRTIIPRFLSVFSGKASSVLHSQRKSSTMLSDRILADALMLAAIPSPTFREEQRAAFVLERIASMGINPRVDEFGNIGIRIHCASGKTEPPLLLFTDLGSNRWHPLESLSRIDATVAKGAGLADVLGTAALLSAAEGICSGRITPGRDVVFLFSAHSFDDPESDAFHEIAESPDDRPFAAIGVQGFLLGSIATYAQGNYRIEIRIASEREDPAPPEGEEPPGDCPNPVVDTLISMARNLSGITWDSERTTHCHIRRIEAGTGFGRIPSEGIIELELESSDGPLLDVARTAVTATAEKAGEGKDIKISVNIVSFVPAGDGKVNADFIQTISDIMKELHIKIHRDSRSDPAAFLSIQGIPALSLGLAQGRTGLNVDTVDIASLDKGRQLIESIIEKITKEQA